MSCGCIYVDDYDNGEPYSETIRKARKIHVCCECKREIQSKEEYQVATGKWNGNFNTFKTCKDCLSVRDEFFCDGFLFTSLWEFVTQHICDMNGEISSDCLIKLTKPARDKICNIIEERWEDIEYCTQ